MKKAFITGVTGQDGSYLAELLLRKGYEVHGLTRRSSTSNTERIDHLLGGESSRFRSLILHYGDLGDGAGLLNLIGSIEPDEVYNLGAQSHVRVSFDVPEHTADVTGLGAVRLLEAIRRTGIDTKFYQASSSEMFGNAAAPQDETTPLQPRSPYGAAKVLAHQMTRNYREAYGLHAVNGILFNHESPRRGDLFVTRKVSRSVARIVAGASDELRLGNLDAVRDWGYAPEYVEGIWRMMQEAEPDDYLLATGTGTSVRQFVCAAFEHVDLDWREYVRFDQSELRPTEVDNLVGDASKAAERFGWSPSVGATELAAIMVDADIRALASAGSVASDVPATVGWA